MSNKPPKSEIFLNLKSESHVIWGLKHFWRAGQSWKALAQKAWEEARKYYSNIVIILLQRKLRDTSQQIRKNARLKAQLK